MKLNKRCSILFHLLVPGGKWQISKRRSRSSASCCKATFHNRLRLPIAAPAIGGNHQFSRARKSPRAHLVPPTPNAGGGELRRVMIDSDADPALVAGQIVNPVRNRLTPFLFRKVMHLHFHRLSLSFPFLARILEFTH